MDVTFPVAAGAIAFGSDKCPALQIGNDPSRLAGSWSCNVSEGVTSSANWTFTAQGFQPAKVVPRIGTPARP
ncbi:MAG: hypothetical protein ACT4PM_02680 [Gemmatimonadales bacterium]